MDYNSIYKDFISDNDTPKKELTPEIDDSCFVDISDKNCCFRECSYLSDKVEIYKIGQNKYYLPKCIIFKYIFLYFFINSIVTPIVFFFVSELDLIIIIICPIYLTIELIISCIVVIEVSIVLEPCSLVVIYGAIFYKKRKTYYYTEIENVVANGFGLYLILKNGEEENILGKDCLLICQQKNQKKNETLEEKGKFVPFSNFLKSNIKIHL